MQNRDLRNIYQKSGAGQVPAEAQLDTLELAVLGYLGEEPASGIPNCARAPVRPGDEKFLMTPDTKVNRTSTQNPNHLRDMSSLMQDSESKDESNQDAVPDSRSPTASEIGDFDEFGVQPFAENTKDSLHEDANEGIGTVEVLGKSNTM